MLLKFDTLAHKPVCEGGVMTKVDPKSIMTQYLEHIVPVGFYPTI